MKTLCLSLLLLCTLSSLAQTDSLSAIADIKAFQDELNAEYMDAVKSPLEPEVRETFEGHAFFPIDLRYRVNAKLTLTPESQFFQMKTTTSRLATERIYGYVSFALEGEEFRLPVYQSKDLVKNPEYADYLFFPFADETNGKETYSGGRYIDLRIPKEGANIVIDFNKAYNPYCAYSPRYSCPIVPSDNVMAIAVRAGTMYAHEHKPKVPENSVDVEPEYPGGIPAMMKFVSKKLVYPRAAVKQKIQGIVYVQFVVQPDGSVSDIVTLRGIHPSCDREAERVVGLMPKWKPGQRNGENVAVRYVLPIKFKGRASWTK